jgi:hypothetical protein
MGFSLRDSERFFPLHLGATAHATLQEFIDIDVRTEDLARILRANKPYLRLFREFVGQRVREKEEPEPNGARPRPTPTRRLVGLLGMIGSRNLILTLRMNEAVRGSFPVNEEGTLEVKTSAFLKCAQQAEDFFARNRLPYGETAFAAGLLFDWINLALKEQGHYPNLEQFFQETWKEAFRAGVIAFELAKEVPGQLPQRCLPALTCAYAGKLLLAAGLGVAYRDFLHAQKADPRLDPLARLVQERAAFGTSYEEVAAQAAAYFSVFKPYAPTIRRLREPYLLKGGDAAHEAEARVLLLSESAAGLRALPNSEKDGALAELSPRSRAALKLEPARLLAALKRASAYR